MQVVEPSAASGECYVISLRPVGDHATLRRAAARHGMRVLALSPWKLQRCDDDATRRALKSALSAERIIVSSPAAVRAADALLPLHEHARRDWHAVGEGTASTLRRVGVKHINVPRRMDSEGLLALPSMQDVRGHRIGLITAPGGRGHIASALHAGGADLIRANVYLRVPVAPAARSVSALLRIANTRPAWLALSSGDALLTLLDALPADAASALQHMGVVAASPRLAQLAREQGFTDAVIAADARPSSLVKAIVEARAGRPETNKNTAPDGPIR